MSGSWSGSPSDAWRRHRQRGSDRSPLASAALLIVVLALGLLACAGGTGEDAGGWFVRYERAYPELPAENQTIWPDGRLVMRHGEHLERLTISAEDVDRLQEALAGEIPTGPPDGAPRRTLTLGDGTVIEDVRPEPGTAAELLERLLDRHTLEP